jgi:hypothetical protein
MGGSSEKSEFTVRINRLVEHGAHNKSGHNGHQRTGHTARTTHRSALLRFGAHDAVAHSFSEVGERLRLSTGIVLMLEDHRWYRGQSGLKFAGHVAIFAQQRRAFGGIGTIANVVDVLDIGVARTSVQWEWLVTEFGRLAHQTVDVFDNQTFASMVVAVRIDLDVGQSA